MYMQMKLGTNDDFEGTELQINVVLVGQGISNGNPQSGTGGGGGGVLITFSDISCFWWSMWDFGNGLHDSVEGFVHKWDKLCL